jgi:alkanesulfonate monooxygenase SsuD/methylene tetrahydromethanopterin reductase-like flavin-dependent oxidoreductase (luciferase family)
MLLSTVILPIERWQSSSDKWRRADELGFHAAYTYDHLSWMRLKERPWFGAIPTLSAAALVTTRIRLGTMVTTPNFRHPVPLAKDLLSIDDLSMGRLTVGVGSGGLGADATVLGSAEWSIKERGERFAEFVALLAELLGNSEVTFEGEFYNSLEARMLPGTVQKPRPPLFVAANGIRGMRLAAQWGEGWITLGRSVSGDESCMDVVSNQVDQLDGILSATGRDPMQFDKVLLNGLSDEHPASELPIPSCRFACSAPPTQRMHRTNRADEPNSLFDADMNIFERVATEALTQI